MSVNIKSRSAGLAFFLAAFSAGASFAADCNKIDLLLATTPAPPQSSYVWRRYEASLGLLTSTKQVKVVLIGDSLAEKWPQGLAGAVSIFNYGSGGDQTQQTIWRLMDDRLKLLDPQNAVIMVGTNNVGNGEAPCGAIAGIKEVVRRTAELWPKANIVLMQIPPRYDTSFNIERQQNRKDINRELSALPGVTSLNSDELLACQSATSCEAFMPEKVHFSPRGYQLLWSLIEPNLL